MEGVNMGRWIHEGLMDGGDLLMWEGADSDPCVLSQRSVIGSYATKGSTEVLKDAYSGAKPASSREARRLRYKIDQILGVT
ncbi:hypothetical protein Tco_0794765 [Tanacetum coccineum]